VATSLVVVFSMQLNKISVVQEKEKEKEINTMEH